MVSQTAQSDHDPQFLAAVEEITARLISGEEISQRILEAEYPHYAAELAELMTTMRAAADWGDSEISSSLSTDADMSSWQAPPCPLGDFRLIKEIGRGGMGIVYEAEQLSLSRRVALKVLPLAAMLDEKQRRRFQHEARAAAMLRHPHIVGVHAVGCDRGVHFYAMDLINGQSLAQVIERMREDVAWEHGSADEHSEQDIRATLSTERSKDRRVYFRRIAQLGVQAAEALHFAHTEGVVHRDVKPSNLMLDDTGKLHVTDFGLATSQNAEGLTMTGDLVGTLRYMSPEQASGQSSLVDHRTDIYSLGVTLYELLALRPPFEVRDRALLLRQVVERDPPPLRSVESKLPSDLETIVMKAMSKDPTVRYASAEELAEDLRCFIDRRPIRARRVTALDRFRRWTGRNPALAAALGLILGLLLFVATTAVLVARQQSDLARNRRSELYVADMLLAQQRWREGNAGKTLELLAKHEPGDQEDLRGFEWFHLWKICHDPRLLASYKLRQKVFEGPSVAVARGSGAIATNTTGDTVRVFDGRSGKVIVELPMVDSVHCMDIASDGSWLAAMDSDYRTLKIWSLLDGTLRRSWQHGEAAIDLAISADGSRIATGGKDGVVRVWPADGRDDEPLATFEAHMGRAFDVEFAADGKTLYSAGGDHAVCVWDIDSNQLAKTLTGHQDWVTCLAVSPHAPLLATGSRDGTVRLWNSMTWEQSQPLRRHKGAVWAVGFAENGLLATGGEDGNVYVWDLSGNEPPDPTRIWTNDDAICSLEFNPTNQNELVVAQLGRIVRLNISGKSRPITIPGPLSKDTDKPSFAWHAWFVDDDRSLLTTNPQILSLWDRASGEEKRSLFQYAWFRDVSLAPDERTLVASSYYGELIAWDLQTGRQLRRIKPYNGKLFQLIEERSPDGRVLATNDYGQITLWDSSTLKRLGQGDDLHGFLSYSPVDELVATGTPDGCIRVLDSESRKEIWKSSGHPGSVNNAKFSPDGVRIASCNSGDGKVRLWDAATGTLLHVLDGGDDVATVETENAMAFSPSGRLLATACQDGRIRIWDVKSGDSFQDIRAHSRQLASVAFSSDGQLMVSAGNDGMVKVWDVGQALPPSELEGPQSRLVGISFSPDGQRLAAGGDEVREWDWRTGEQLPPSEGGPWVQYCGGHVISANVNSVSDDLVEITFTDADGNITTLQETESVRHVTLSSDGQFVLVTGAPGARLWDAQSKTLVWRTHSASRSSVINSTNETVAVSQEPGLVVFYDLHSGKKLRYFGDGVGVGPVCFAEDDSMIAAGADDSNIYIWSTLTGELLSVMEGHTHLPNSLCFSPDGRRLASAGQDGVRLWDTNSGAELATFRGSLIVQGIPTNGIAFSPDGTALVSATSHETIHIWRAATKEEVEADRSRND